MPQSKSKYQFYQEASLSQKLADKIPLYQKLAGTDRYLSDSIAVLEFFRSRKVFAKDDPEIDMIIGLLNVLRMSAFATSERVNEITKMGMQMPKAEDIVGLEDE